MTIVIVADDLDVFFLTPHTAVHAKTSSYNADEKGWRQQQLHRFPIIGQLTHARTILPCGPFAVNTSAAAILRWIISP